MSVQSFFFIIIIFIFFFSLSSCHWSLSLCSFHISFSLCMSVSSQISIISFFTVFVVPVLRIFRFSIDCLSGFVRLIFCSNFRLRPSNSSLSLSSSSSAFLLQFPLILWLQFVSTAFNRQHPLSASIFGAGSSQIFEISTEKWWIRSRKWVIAIRESLFELISVLILKLF